MKDERTYPPSFAVLTKGMEVPDEIIDCVVEDRTDPFRLLAACNEIERYFRDVREIRVTCTCRQNKLKILTDAEASMTNARRTRARLRGVQRDHNRNLGVNMAALSPEERIEHQRRVTRQAQLLQGIRSVRWSL